MNSDGNINLLSVNPLYPLVKFSRWPGASEQFQHHFRSHHGDIGRRGPQHVADGNGPEAQADQKAGLVLRVSHFTTYFLPFLIYTPLRGADGMHWPLRL